MHVARRTLVFRFVQPVDNDVALGDAQRIEVLAHCERQLILVYSSLWLWSCHGRREATDALAEDNVTQWVLEGRRGVEAVGSSVALKDGRFL